jgi:hypothetical protein
MSLSLERALECIEANDKTIADLTARVAELERIQAQALEALKLCLAHTATSPHVDEKVRAAITAIQQHQGEKG